MQRPRDTGKIKYSEQSTLYLLNLNLKKIFHYFLAKKHSQHISHHYLFFKVTILCFT